MNEYMKMLKQLEFRKQTEEAKFEAFALMCEKVADLEKEKCELLGIIQGKDKAIKELKQKLEQTEKDLADYQFNYPSIKELSKENAEQKDKLTKAKDHIKTLLDCLKQDTNDPQTNYYVCQYMDKAEQFLKEIEK